jgi:hypothetical protein
MFHQPSAGVCGTVDEILTQAQYLVGLRDRMFEDMAARCGTTGPELSAEHQTMKIYTAQQALEKGFIDRISGADDEPETEPETVTEPEPVQNACRVYEYERVQMAMAMAAEEDAEPASAPEELRRDKPETEPDPSPADASAEAGTEPETEPETEPDPSPADASAEAGTEPSAAPEELRRDKPETEPETKPATDAAIAKMVADEVQRQLAIREAEMLAELGAPVASLPASAAGGSCGVASRASFSMAELDAMPAMQRLEVLQQDSALAAAYAAHI